MESELENRRGTKVLPAMIDCLYKIVQGGSGEKATVVLKTHNTKVICGEKGYSLDLFRFTLGENVNCLI